MPVAEPASPAAISPASVLLRFSHPEVKTPAPQRATAKCLKIEFFIVEI
jgi:hypothetical protein